jgi:DNA-binding sugar fermentation-stimulating protein
MSIVYKFPFEDMVECTMMQRPSSKNKSPYVADVQLENEQRVAIAHVPSLHLGNKCVPGSQCLMKFARKNNKARDRVGKDEISSKYGTPKCELHSCLVRHNGVWIGAHPKIGEDIAGELLKRETIYQPIHSSKIVDVKREVSKVAKTDMRSDYLLTHEDGTYSLVEVKSVVDSDSDDNPDFEGPITGVFPWGKRNQKHNNEKVVSARAIKHVSEMTEISKGNKKDDRYDILRTCVLFVVVRGDCDYFRPRDETCPVFARVLKEAKEHGVKIMAHRIKWEVKDHEIVGKDDGNIDILL